MFAKHLAILALFTGTAYGQLPPEIPINVSMLVNLTPGGSATLGFVASPRPSGASGPLYLIRAVGPSLAAFGVAHPCASVTYTVYDSQGNSAMDRTDMTPGGEAYNWPLVDASVGAFSLAYIGYGESSDIFSFATGGAYTIQITDTSGKGGAAMIEVYYNAYVYTILPPP